MKGAGAAETHQGEVTRIKTLFNRDQSQCPKHVLVNDVDDPFGSLL